MHRREFLYGLGAGLGSVALTALLAEQKAEAGPLAERRPHHPARARACIFLLMEGGPSHLDTFDPKPRLERLHMSEFVRQDRFASAMESGRRYFVASPFRFRKAGRMGMDVCEHFEHLADCVDDMCFYRGCVAESTDHPTALYHLNTGNRFGGDPAMGAWVTYGLGTVNENLPAFLVLPDVTYPQGGAANWSNGFLPAHFQGTALRNSGTPILELQPPAGVTRTQQQDNLRLLSELNREHALRHPHHQELAARMDSYELAFRMQTEVPETLNIDGETAATRRLYGIGERDSDAFGRKCLLARRLVERGVRFVQLYAGGWDSHDYIEEAHRNRMRAVDKPIAGLLKDLKRRGLLESTLVVWGGEFGRSPDNGNRGGVKVGRDHNARAMTIWLAGGGAPAGRIVGATDDIGQNAVEVVHPLRDLHVTLLHLLGLDDNRLTYFHGGRFKHLSQTGGQVIRPLLS
ncbi:MAG: DUF1501 domain-containing protein [Gemmataceae bacterium]|nr:DUF1501 domain-containing protein [Gemmataceae bacterium]